MTVPNDRRGGVNPRLRATAVAAVLALHLVVIVLVVRAFGMAGIVSTVRSVTAFVIPLAPPPSPPPPPPPQPKPAPSQPAAPAAPAARPKQIVAPKPQIVIPREAVVAPPVAGTGGSAQAGASDAGSGSGAGGFGTGSGSGAAYLPQSAVKTAGDIVSARDYPREGRAARAGSSVTIALRVGTDGRVKGCTVVRTSPDPQADATTCLLATKRFRFRPALDQNGQPIESTFGWRQRWFN